MQSLKRAIRIAKWIMIVISLMFAVIVWSARLPYVSKDDVELILFCAFSALFFSFFVVLFYFYKGTVEQPAGFAYISRLWKGNNRTKALKLLLAIPLFSALVGYFFAVFFEVSFAYPTMSFAKDVVGSNAICLRSGRDRIRGSWSLFRVSSNEEWKLAGYGRLCEHHEGSCELTFIRGYFGYYVTRVACS